MDWEIDPSLGHDDTSLNGSMLGKQVKQIPTI
jgi:hypothetical protein